MKKKTTARLLSVLLSLVLVLSLPLAAYADTGEQESFKASAAEGEAAVPENGVSNDLDAIVDGNEVIADEDGNYYAVEVEEIEDDAYEGEGYDPALLEEAKEALAIQEDADALEVIETVYEMAVTTLPADMERVYASDFLNELLVFAKADSVLVKGLDENNEEAAWVLVRFAEDEPYFILDPVRDLSEVSEDDAAEFGSWKGFLLGTEDIEGWTAAEEFLTEEFTAAYPVSEKVYVIPEEQETEETQEVTEEEKEDKDTEETKENVIEETEEDESADPKESDKEDADKASDKEDNTSDKDKASDKEVNEEKEESAEEKAGEEPEASVIAPEAAEDLSAEEVEEALKDYNIGDSTVVMASGTFPNTNVSWYVVQYIIGTTNAYFLVFDGSGAVPKIANSSSQPWRSTPYGNFAPLISGVVVGANITEIGDNACRDLNIKAVSFAGNKVTRIGEHAFRSTALTSFSAPAGIETIAYYAFGYCSNLETVSFPASLKSLGSYVFTGCPFTKVVLPKGLTYVGSGAFNFNGNVYFSGTQAEWDSVAKKNALGANTKLVIKQNITSNNVSLTLPPAGYYGYNGAAKKPTVTVKVGNKVLQKGTDYRVAYKNNKNAGTATVTVSGIYAYGGTVKKTFAIKKADIRKAKVTGVKNVSYLGKPRTFSKLKVQIYRGGKWITLKKNRDYKLVYYRNTEISTSTSKALVKIVGRGNYQYVIKKTFRIIKGTPGLRFSTNKVKRKEVLGKFKKTASISAKATLTKYYSSSNTAVATVGRKTGVVTPKKVGTTIITAITPATKHYKRDKASYKLILRALTYKELAYWFKNYASGSIPESIFRLFYSSTEAKTMHEKYGKTGGQGGHCFGISSSTILMNIPKSGLKLTDFNPKATIPDDLYKSDNYKNTDYTLGDFISAMQVSQWAPPCWDLIFAHAEQLQDVSIPNLIKNVQTGMPAIVMVFPYNQGGHALVGYKVKVNSNNDVRLYVYDCNFPYDETRYIKFTRTSANHYTNWEYDLSPEKHLDGQTDQFTWISGFSYRKIWNNRGAATKLSCMFVSSDNFEIQNTDGRVVASMADGQFNSSDDRINLAMSVDAELKDNMVYMPSGEYTVVNTKPDENGFEVTGLDTNVSVAVTTDSDTVKVNFSNDEAKGKASIEADKGQEFEVKVLRAESEDAEPEEVVFSGEGTGKEVTLGTEGGSLIMENAEEVVVEVDGEEIAYTAE